MLYLINLILFCSLLFPSYVVVAANPLTYGYSHNARASMLSQKDPSHFSSKRKSPESPFIFSSAAKRQQQEPLVESAQPGLFIPATRQEEPIDQEQKSDTRKRIEEEIRFFFESLNPETADADCRWFIQELSRISEKYLQECTAKNLKRFIFTKYRHLEKPDFDFLEKGIPAIIKAIFENNDEDSIQFCHQIGSAEFKEIIKLGNVCAGQSEQRLMLPSQTFTSLRNICRELFPGLTAIGFQNRIISRNSKNTLNEQAITESLVQNAKEVYGEESKEFFLFKKKSYTNC